MLITYNLSMHYDHKAVEKDLIHFKNKDETITTTPPA